MPNHIHLLLSVPPRYSVERSIGCLKSSSVIQAHGQLLKTKKTLFSRSFLSLSY
ncbi:MAG: transposase [Desulfatiglandales bacterium]